MEPIPPRKRIWVQQVAVDAAVLETRLQAACARGLTPSQQAVAEGVAQHIERARSAAYRDDPLPGRWANWWSGTLLESAYRNVHAAQTGLIDLYDKPELHAEVRHAVARARVALSRDDPRRTTVEELCRQPPEQLRPRLRRLVSDSFAAIDGQHGQLRSFRNVLLLAALVVLLLMTLTIGVATQRPQVLPLCFPPPGQAAVTSAPAAERVPEGPLNCPTRKQTTGATGGDVPLVALLGALGGALAATVAIRGLKGTSTPYDVPVALALLKIPLGAFTAVLALLAIGGDFVPGLSALDSQTQILAYAVFFGFAQQLFTRLLDRRAQTLLEGLPGKDARISTPLPGQRSPESSETRPEAPAF